MTYAIDKRAKQRVNTVATNGLFRYSVQGKTGGLHRPPVFRSADSFHGCEAIVVFVQLANVLEVNGQKIVVH